MNSNPSSLSPTALQFLSELLQTIHHLRAPGGCPWDRKQTHQSLRPYLIEEAYEVLDVLDQIHSPQDLKNATLKNSFCEELGDVLMQVLLHSEIASETKAFDFFDVAQSLNKKLIRRHPHVFGELKADSPEAALQRWEKEKSKEKATSLDASILDGVPRQLPALQRAARVIEKVTRVGFQWKDMEGPLAKVEEEFNELKVEIQAFKNSTESVSKQALKKVEAELGDLLFSVSNLAFLLKLNPENALRTTVHRFEKRFQHVERRLKENGKTPEQSNLSEMDIYWDEAKKLESVQIWGLTGGIASGKSSAAKFFAEAGIPVIDADQITQELSRPGGKAHDLIVQRFGTADPKQLRELVFENPGQNPQNKKDLELLLHPLIIAESKKRFLQLGMKHSILIYEATLLIESDRFKEFTGILVVDAPEDIRLQRLLMTREGMTLEMAQKIIASQLSRSAFIQKAEQHPDWQADWILENHGDLVDLKKKVQTLLSTISSRKSFAV